jgi:putative transposase
VWVRRTLKYRPYENRRNRRLHRQIDIAVQIWNHITALQRRYYRMYGGYINKYRMMKHIGRLFICFSGIQDVGKRQIAPTLNREPR